MNSYGAGTFSRISFTPGEPMQPLTGLRFSQSSKLIKQLSMLNFNVTLNLIAFLCAHDHFLILSQPNQRLGDEVE